MPPKGKGKPNPKNKNKNKQAHRKTTASAARIIPHEVLSGILSRLPAKSLLRFKCVSKQWCTLTSLQSFISAHLSRAPTSLLIHAHYSLDGDDDDNEPNLDCEDNQPNPGGDDNQPNPDGDDNQPNPDGDDNQPNPDRDDNQATPDGDDNPFEPNGDENQPSPDRDDNQANPDGDANQFEPNGDENQFDHALYSYRPLNPSTKTRSSVDVIDTFPGSGVVPFDYCLEVIGSTPNGIVCIVQKPFAENLTLWNPATRFSRSIRSPKLKANSELHGGVSIGLGYDPSRNDIKIVRILCPKVLLMPPDEVEVYSLKSGAWTIMNLENITPFSVRSFKCDVVFEGVPYWRCLVHEPRILDCVQNLVSFLPEKSVLYMEDFGMYLKDRYSPVRMGEIQGCLAAVSWEFLGRGKDLSQMIDVWLRYKKVGWKKLYRVGPLPVIGRVLGLYEERGVVQEHENGDLYMFDFKKKVVEDRLHSFNMVVPKSYMMLRYKESLTRIPKPGCSVI